MVLGWIRYHILIEFEEREGFRGLDVRTVPGGADDWCAAAVTIVVAVRGGSILDVVFYFCKETSINASI